MGANLTRRAVLTSAPVLAVSMAAAPVMAEIGMSKEDPIMAVYRDWCTAREEWFDLSDTFPEPPELDEAANREFDAFYRMAEMQPVTMEGMAALAHVFWNYEGPQGATGSALYEEECGTRSNRLVAAIWRAGSGEAGVPPRPDMKQNCRFKLTAADLK
jgi:hypothetical protein